VARSPFVFSLASFDPGSGENRPARPDGDDRDAHGERRPGLVEPSSHDVTEFLIRWSGGDNEALDGLVSRVYDDLRRMAGRYLNDERSGHTLQTHDLIHEAFLRLIDQRDVDWQNRAHFFGIAARMMRRILIDHARRRAAGKHGGGAKLTTLGEIEDVGAGSNAAVLAVDEALEELKEIDQELARIVELRFFGGLRHEEIAVVLGTSVPTVGRRFRIAKAWLYRRLRGSTAADRHRGKDEDRGD
jgi:RNA polymerase sigma factor (TIGR02999 family)